MICLPPQGTPPPQHSSRHGPQHAQHTSSTVDTALPGIEYAYLLLHSAYSLCRDGRRSTASTCWPLQDIVLLRSFCARVNHSFLAPSPALPALLQCYCTSIAQYTTPPPTPHVYAMHNTILAMAISCKGQSTLAVPHLAFTCHCHYQYGMVYGIQKGNEAGSYIAQRPCNSIIKVSAIQVGGNTRMMSRPTLISL